MNATRDGLDVRTLGFMERSALKLTAAWSVRRFAFGMPAVLFEGASGVGLITLAANADPVSAGLAREHVWLRATQRGLAFDVCTAS